MSLGDLCADCRERVKLLHKKIRELFQKWILNECSGSSTTRTINNGFNRIMRLIVCINFKSDFGRKMHNAFSY